MVVVQPERIKETIQIPTLNQKLCENRIGSIDQTELGNRRRQRRTVKLL